MHLLSKRCAPRPPHGRPTIGWSPNTSRHLDPSASCPLRGRLRPNASSGGSDELRSRIARRVTSAGCRRRRASSASKSMPRPATRPAPELIRSEMRTHATPRSDSIPRGACACPSAVTENAAMRVVLEAFRHPIGRLDRRPAPDARPLPRRHIGRPWLSPLLVVRSAVAVQPRGLVAICRRSRGARRGVGRSLGSTNPMRAAPRRPTGPALESVGGVESTTSSVISALTGHARRRGARPQMRAESAPK